MDIPEEEIDRLRRETRGCTPGKVYLNNASSSLPPRPVVERVIAHLRREEDIGGYSAALETAQELEQIYLSVAEMLHGQPDEVALVESATRAWQMAFYSFPLNSGDKIITAENEYGSNYIGLLQLAKRTGAQIVVIPSTATGEIDLESLEGELGRGSCGCIVLTHVATNNGMVQPAEEVGRLARKYAVPFLLDACQSIGQLDLDVRKLGCDALTATGRKHLRAPRGTGFLWMRRDLYQKLEPVMLDAHGASWVSREAYELYPDAKRFETFESNVAAKLGLGVAVRYATDIGFDRIETRVGQLAERLREKLSQIEGVELQDLGKRRCGIVTFTSAPWTCSQLIQALGEKGIIVRSSTIDLTRIDMERRRLQEVMRASVHYYNTEEELERFCSELKEILSSRLTSKG